ncbi:M17 family metallopeptidase [Acidocella sp.]|uniref:leucyl aminopeptidase family protein n=1 Tax=Acidocella sp. TaxID=50710 RepID=UPI0026186457|nr:leucyl aminopeptidase family protein [Acidocella sp.]
MTEPHAGLAPETATPLPLHGVRPEGLAALLATLPPAIGALARLQGFTAAPGKLLLLPDTTGTAPAGALLGLGALPALHGFGAAPAILPAGSAWHIAPGDYPAEEAALGFLLGAYRFTNYKTKQNPLAQLSRANLSKRTLALAEAASLARTLINTPANDLGPDEFAQAALRVANTHGATTELVEGAELAARYPTLALVGAGSARAPRVVVLRWQGPTAPPAAPLISLCGKGVCFDTGGYDLKPSAAMLRMKKDMAGAAILLALTQAVMQLGLPLRLELRLGLVENSVSGTAMRPGDIVRTRAGKTVEIGNTDAEGRLVLCDLLSEAAEAAPAWLLDAATLTGAARVALGPDLPALFCTHDSLAETLLQAGRAAHEPFWRLPLHADYQSWLDSPVADLCNVSSKPHAGAITAALFLQQFVPAATPWAHLDVYGWNDNSRPGRPEGGEAQGLRALLGALELHAYGESP